MSKMGKGAFKKWAHQNRSNLVTRFKLEQAPAQALQRIAEDNGVEVEPGTRKAELVKTLMGGDYPIIPEGYNTRKVCRVLGIPTELKSKAVGNGPLGDQMHIRLPAV
jgi:hypothetical protein